MILCVQAPCSSTASASWDHAVWWRIVSSRSSVTGRLGLLTPSDSSSNFFRSVQSFFCITEIYLNAELDQSLIFYYDTSKLVHFCDKFIIPYRRKMDNKQNLPPIDEKLRRGFLYGQIFLLWHVGIIVVSSDYWDWWESVWVQWLRF